MIIKSCVDITEVQQHENLTDANARVGGYGMYTYCPAEGFSFYLGHLEQQDWNRLYLLGEFAKYTDGGTGRVIDISSKKLEASTWGRVASFSQPSENSNFKPIDLRSAENLALLIVTPDASSGPLVLIDGNHRAISQYLTYGIVSHVPAFLCVHLNIMQWPYVPGHARQMFSQFSANSYPLDPPSPFSGTISSCTEP